MMNMDQLFNKFIEFLESLIYSLNLKADYHGV